MRQVLVCIALLGSLPGCFTLLGGSIGHSAGASHEEAAEHRGEPVSNNYVGDATLIGMIAGAALDALVIYGATHSHSLEHLCFGGDPCPPN